MVRTRTIDIERDRCRNLVTPEWAVRLPTCDTARRPQLNVDLRRSCGARSLDEAQRRAQFEAPPEAGPDYWLG